MHELLTMCYVTVKMSNKGDLTLAAACQGASAAQRPDGKYLYN